MLHSQNMISVWCSKTIQNGLIFLRNKEIFSKLLHSRVENVCIPFLISKQNNNNLLMEDKRLICCCSQWSIKIVILSNVERDQYIYGWPLRMDFHLSVPVLRMARKNRPWLLWNLVTNVYFMFLITVFETYAKEIKYV